MRSDAVVAAIIKEYNADGINVDVEALAAALGDIEAPEAQPLDPDNPNEVYLRESTYYDGPEGGLNQLYHAGVLTDNEYDTIYEILERKGQTNG